MIVNTFVQLSVTDYWIKIIGILGGLKVLTNPLFPNVPKMIIVKIISMGILIPVKTLAQIHLA